MTCGVYIITCKKNSKRYLGISKNIERRWDQHKRELTHGSHHSPKLQADWSKFGEECFKFEILNTVSDPSKLQEFETQWINQLYPEYNVMKYTETVRVTHNQLTRKKKKKKLK